MRKAVCIILVLLTTSSQAQYVGGTGGGGATNCSAAFAMLPVELLSFTATPESDEVLVHWATASELNNAGFHVERSSYGVRFDAIAEVEGIGTAHTVTHYEAIDSAPLPGLSYYRLRQTDLDGTVTWSEGVAVETTLRDSWPIRIQCDRCSPSRASPRKALHRSSSSIAGALGHASSTSGRSYRGIHMSGLPAGLYRVRVSWAQGAGTLSVVKE